MPKPPFNLPVPQSEDPVAIRQAVAAAMALIQPFLAVSKIGELVHPGGNNLFDFTNIPEDYSHLLLIGSQNTAGASGVGVRFNGDTANNYIWTDIVASGGAITSGTSAATSLARIGAAWNSNHVGVFTFIPFYRGGAQKRSLSIMYGHNGGAYDMRIHGGHWSGTAAISRLQVVGDTQNFNAGSIFSLYGIG